MTDADRPIGNPPAIITPFVDAFCCGGFSIFLIGGFIVHYLFFPPEWEGYELDVASVVIAGTLINFPHFMASYGLLYISVGNVRRYSGAALYVPAVLIAIIVYAVLTASGNEEKGYANETISNWLPFIASVYLAWHYTGQAWGMTASFSYINGVRIDATERFLIRCGYRGLLAFHVSWMLVMAADRPPPYDAYPWYAIAHWHDQIATAYHALAFGALITFLLGLFGFWRLSQRVSRNPPLCAVLPWIAIYLWYLLVYIQPKAFFLLQFSHALQYLIFPMRVELNRYKEKKRTGISRPALHLAIYYFVLMFAGYMVFKAPTSIFRTGDPKFQLATVIAASVCIHHYFVDGCVWKISNPEVRRELFAHLTPSKSLVPSRGK